MDGFSFCISNLENEKDELFTEYLFDTQLKTPEALLEEIKPVFKNDKNLHLDFKNVNIIYRNNLNSIVPIAYFDESNLLLKIQQASNDNYLKTYKLKSPIIESDTLMHSYLELNAYSDDLSLTSSVEVYEDLNKPDRDRY